jgi:L-alanine-DL-glutamate epimerase-like enolase superfamily enzyme
MSPQVETASKMLAWLDEQTMITSPVRYAIELACFDLLGKQSHQTVAALLWSTHTDRIPCHTTLKSWAEHVDFNQWTGRALKIKMGLLDPDIEYHRVKAMLIAQPAIQLRLDANGSWGLSHARRMCKLAEPYPNVVIEQPLAKDQFEALDQLQLNTTTIIALDESFILSPDAALATTCREIVVKPMYAGGLSISKMRCSQIAEAQKRICVTHALEGAVGRAGTQHFAAGINTNGAHGVGHATSAGYVTLNQSDGHGVVQ